jgi:HAMP domain-containing protein
MRRALAAAALVAVAVTLFLVARSRAPESLRLTTTGTRYAATVLIDHPTTARVSVEVRPTSGDPDAVALSSVMPAMGHATPEITAQERAPGRFVAEGELFPMAAVWELSIRLTGPAGEETLVVNVPITG